MTSQASSPTLDLPAKPVAPKTTARVNVAKTDTTAPTEPVSAPLQLGSAAASGAAEKPQKLLTKLRPPETQVASAPPAAAPAASGGDWAVQLAAPRSEADAQSAIQKLQTKYASALGDSELGVHKAEVNGDTIYRVRASGLSKSDGRGAMPAAEGRRRRLFRRQELTASPMPKAFISGCRGLTLTPDERAFLRAEDPWGLILFKRNVQSRAQLSALTSEFRSLVGRADAPVLIDQEGGRVQRMGPPHWRAYPAAARFLAEAAARRSRWKRRRSSRA